MLRYLSAGESHGPALFGIIDGLPAGLSLSEDDFAPDLAARQGGYGRGGRMAIETDRAEILSGVNWGQGGNQKENQDASREMKTITGAPLTLRIENRDWENWRDKVLPPITIPRPGHADLSGWMKYHQNDMRLVLERASARETAMRVAIGAVAKKLIAQCGIEVISYVKQIAAIEASITTTDFSALRDAANKSSVRCPDSTAEGLMTHEIDLARSRGDTLGGIFEVIVRGVPPGLGTFVQWDRRLDGKLAQAMMSIPAIKGIEIGAGFANAALPGSKVHDELTMHEGKLCRPTNRAGGIEGGMTNGEWILIRAAMKPIPSLVTPLQSVDLATMQPAPALYQRSDVCAVPAASVVGAAAVAWVIAESLIDKFGGDTIDELKTAYERYVQSLGALWPSESS